MRGKTAKTQRSAKKKPPKKERDPVITGLLVFTCSLALMISIISASFHSPPGHLMGSLGLFLGRSAIALFGVSSYAVAMFCLWAGWRLLFLKPMNNLVRKILYISLFVFSSNLLLSLLEDRAPIAAREIERLLFPGYLERGGHPHLGGTPFFYIYKDLPVVNLSKMLSSYGIALFSIALILTSFCLLFKISPSAVVDKLKGLLPERREPPPDSSAASTPLDPIDKVEELKVDEPRLVKIKTSPFATNQEKDSQREMETLMIKPQLNLTERPSLSRKNIDEFPVTVPSLFSKPAKIEETPTETSEPKPKGPAKSSLRQASSGELNPEAMLNLDRYTLPPVSLLTPAVKNDTSSLKKDLRRQAEVLEETLQSFGIEAKVGQINCGPTINSFEVHPAIGVKVQRIKTLENDIALNMEAKSIRIIAPIPGKAAVGIEIPNPSPQEVGFKDMLQAYQQGGKKFSIPILLGKSVAGEWVVSDLAKMPHLIIAGATGSGKSVCINTIVMSILMTARPDEIKMIMVDPKKVELTGYTKLPHMLSPVINEPFGACQALKWLVKEMERRYEILKHLGLRNIQSFNQRVPDEAQESSLSIEIPKKLPYIVGIIDELADLMMAAEQDIETPIARIAQMARAVGIHLILATQRPSREVITGLIKANFPTRIAFKVASRVNSQIILDEVGAESLLGNGDMLFLPPGTSHLSRAQGAYVRDEDIAKVVQYICDQAPPQYAIASFDNSIDTDNGVDDDTGGDELFRQAKEIVIKTGNASTTFLQRKLKIGYARAASLMDEMESRGIVGPQEGSKPRKVLAKGALALAEEPGVNDIDQ
ncbi:FtsK/SpoIIIE family DNA translocase [Estrella lausannensis]|uniref:DNA translocase FtsK n=1 Tax=Estrella lausannensis TaxID=483423 RepID=A0A0H5DQY8_9BACT|nr:DNA translocase FtsK [Estrella lausannensis]CRX38548.1 DNA translocase FtsK [Estrella lausannensis]